MRHAGLFLASLLVFTGCVTPTDDGPEQPPVALNSEPASPLKLAKRGAPDVDAPQKRTLQPPQTAAKAGPATARLKEALPKAEQLLGKTKTWFEGHAQRRIYVQVDKPLYKPGETIWIKTWDLAVHDLAGDGANGINYQLVSPKGAVVLRKRVPQAKGTANNDFVIPEGVQGGAYILRAKAFDGTIGERKLIVSTYEPPRIKKKLEFVRKAYGVGDLVKATITVKRPTGEPLANRALRAQVVVDGNALPEITFSTDAHGGGLVRFTLPSEIAREDALLTVLVDDGGVTESVSKRIPIILKKLKFSFFPEGGDLVEGLPGRVYFAATNTIDKPADVEGEIIDDQGNAVARFASYKNGLGRFAFTPQTGRTYTARILKPVGVTERYTMPIARAKGCVIQHFDDVDGQVHALRVAVRCATPQKVLLTAVVREQIMDVASVEVPEGSPAIVYLEAKGALAKARGVARITLFNDALEPLAERIVMRNRRAGLQVKITPDQASYVPREQVALTVQTTTADGQPVPAELALSVVDDTVISFADDKKGHLLSKMLLEGEIPGKIEEPKFYFDLKEAKSAVAMDLLMGTRGYRRFEWQPVFAPPVIEATGLGMMGMGRGGGGAPMAGAIGVGDGAKFKGGLGKRRPRGAMPRKPMAQPAGAVAPPAPPVVLAAAKPADAPAQDPAPVVAVNKAEAEAEPVEEDEEVMAEKAMEAPRVQAQGRRARRRPMRIAKDAKADMDELDDAIADEDWNRGDKFVAKERKKKRPVSWAKVRVFPAPTYAADAAGPRTDFRETVFWAPTVQTGKDGKATVTFYLSDSVTSFRVFTEGKAGGALAGIGRTEAVFKSNLPFSMNVKLPLEVSAGDTLLLPLTLTNEQSKPLPVSLSATFGELLKLTKPVMLPSPTLAPKARASLYYPVEVTGIKGVSKVQFAANAGGLKDAFTRDVVVTPRGFPQLFEAAGDIKRSAKMTFNIGDADPRTVTAALKVYPSPVSTLVGGLEGLIRSPSGCFEQTSSSNYPNVMVLKYLQANDVAAPALVDRTGKLIDRGYNRLVGYETKKKGYEWFGHSPPHEALTAYGILQFIDMKNVYGGVDDAMIGRTVSWLKSRRDGKGGFRQSKQALDSFGRASAEVTNAYITYAVSAAGLAAQFGPETARTRDLARTTKDAYLLALAANTLLNLPQFEADARAAQKALVAMQGPDGAWKTADHSITRSRGVNLHIETTALAVLALMQGGDTGAVRRGVAWLTKNRNGYGQWGATQATVLALKAMTEYATLNKVAKADGSLRVLVNGKEVETFNYKAGRKDPIAFLKLGEHFKAGENLVEVYHDGEGALPYSMAMEFVADNPATDPGVVVSLSTKLARDTLKMGENVRLTATLKNTTDKGQPMTLARVGLPGGLTFQTWQLKELVDKKIIDFYETRPREVILYFRDLKPSETAAIPLELVATIPGTFTAPASSAYLYYTDDQKFWAPALAINVKP
jgi:hypothetical protein